MISNLRKETLLVETFLSHCLFHLTKKKHTPNSHLDQFLNEVTMFLPSPFIDDSINVAVSLTSAYMKLVYSVYRTEKGDMELELWPFLPFFLGGGGR